MLRIVNRLLLFLLESSFLIHLFIWWWPDLHFCLWPSAESIHNSHEKNCIQKTWTQSLAFTILIYFALLIASDSLVHTFLPDVTNTFSTHFDHSLCRDNFTWSSQLNQECCTLTMKHICFITSYCSDICM